MTTFRIPLQLKAGAFESVDERDSYLASLWTELSGLVGIHEGSVLAEQAHALGFETESFTVDAAEAPRERDWVSELTDINCELYFDGEEHARLACQSLGLSESLVALVPPQDWDAEWKKSFRGIALAPQWLILPPWGDAAEFLNQPDHGFVNPKILQINPGAGFGTGTHETTQLCFQSLENCLKAAEPSFAVLDFGSGSGILAIGAKILGAAPISGVEIDELALDNARANEELNAPAATGDRIEWALTLDALPVASAARYDIVLANILKPVLLNFAETLVSCLKNKSKSRVILSGLVEADVAQVSECYSALLGRKPSEVTAKGDWRCITW